MIQPSIDLGDISDISDTSYSEDAEFANQFSYEKVKNIQKITRPVKQAILDAIVYEDSKRSPKLKKGVQVVSP
jgi:capsular polysaccharide biosynthesis protein